MKIAIFGTGYVGLVTGACLANLSHDILCVDIDEQKIQQLKEGKIAFFEPGLKELVTKNMEKGRLSFTSDARAAVEFAEVIFNCVGTPSNDDGSADLRHVFAVAQVVARFSTNYKLLINKSTVPPGTAQRCQTLIQEMNPLTEVEVVSNPEFLAEGKAVHDFTDPDKIVFGAKTAKAFSLLRRVYTGRARTYIPVLETDWETAEMIKYANNSFLATKVSFINEVANICEKTGADVKIVAQAMGLDYRINPRFLNPGIGYGGSCFPKDVLALISTGKQHGVDFKILRAADQVNKEQRAYLIEKVLSLYKTLNGKTIAVWGLAFKPKTDDVREAPSITIIKELQRLGAHVCAFDPVAEENTKKILPDIDYAKDPYGAVKGADALIIMTEWDEFRTIDMEKVKSLMKEPSIVDGRNLYDPAEMRKLGFTYKSIGRADA